MKKICFCAIVSLCMIVVACFAFSAGAAEIVKSGTCGADGDNLTWTLDDTGLLTVSGSGDMENYTSSSYVPWYSYRGSITDVVIGDSVTTIGKNAFAYCDSLASVTIGDSVTTIGKYAFYGCDSLTSVTIPDSVTTIGEDAFAYCYSLASVTIPDSVTTIGYSAFYDCDNIEKVYITNLEAWMDISFYNSGSSPLYYGADPYLNGEKLTELIIPDSITTISSYCFSGCTSITSVTIPDSVTTIGDCAFNGCYNLTSVTIGDSVTTIGEGAFYNCNSIEKVYITSLDSWMNISFYNSTSSPLYYDADLYLNGELLTELIIPDSITTINDYSFSGYTSLTSVTIPNSVVSIGNYAFKDCDNLTNVTIGTGITSIGNQFIGCTNLENIIIPTSVTSISTSAFDSLKLIIHGFTGSTADTFAATNGIAFVSLDGFMANYIDGGKCGDNATWELYRNGKLIINGTGKMYNENITTSSYVRSVEIADGITTIGNSAFYGCDSLTSVTIPDSVTAIGNYAFDYCDSLTSVTIPDSVTTIGNSAFYSCDSLASVTIGDSVTTIGGYAFYSCDSLASITIGDSVTTIGDYAFDECTSLTSVTIPDSITSIKGNAFAGCISIEKVHITNLESWMNISFSNAGSTPLYYGADLYLNGEKLINLTIPSTQESIKNYAFYSCESLKTITVSNTTTSIPDSAFKGCNNATIYGYAGSTAETTARANILPFVALDEGWQAKLMYNGKCGDNLMWQLYQNGDLVLSFMNSATSDVIYDYTSSSLPTWNTYSTLVRNVVFPKGITRVGDYAFDKLTGIVTVSYSGDEDSWKETVIGTGNLPLEKAYIIYGEAMNVNINYKDVVKTTATVNGKVIPVIINLEAGTVWQELKDNLIYSDYTDVIVYDHDGILIDLDDLLSTGYILHHINKDGSVIEELLISVSGDVTGDSAVNVDDIQNVVAHLAGDDNELNKIAIDKDLNDVLTMQELNKFIATFR